MLAVVVALFTTQEVGALAVLVVAVMANLPVAALLKLERQTAVVGVGVVEKVIHGLVAQVALVWLSFHPHQRRYQLLVHQQ